MTKNQVIDYIKNCPVDQLSVSVVAAASGKTEATIKRHFSQYISERLRAPDGAAPKEPPAPAEESQSLATQVAELTKTINNMVDAMATLEREMVEVLTDTKAVKGAIFSKNEWCAKTRYSDITTWGKMGSIGLLENGETVALLPSAEAFKTSPDWGGRSGVFGVKNKFNHSVLLVATRVMTDEEREQYGIE